MIVKITTFTAVALTVITTIVSDAPFKREFIVRKISAILLSFNGVSFSKEIKMTVDEEILLKTSAGIVICIKPTCYS